MASKNLDEKTIAKKLILNSLKIEESLASILRTQTKILKRKSNTDISNDELLRINKTVKYLIYYLIVIDDRIQKGLDILQNNKDS